MFVYAKANSIRENIVKQIRMAIFNGKLKPGDKLPPERELIEKFRASRWTVREALRSLESSGFLEIRKGVSGGIFITEIGIDCAKKNFADFFYFKELSMEHLIEARMMLEPSIIAKVALTITPEDLEQLQISIDRSRDEIKLSAKNKQREFMEFHRIIAEMSDNPLLTFLLDVISALPVHGAKVVKQLPKKLSQEVLKSHSRIYEALLQNDPERARKEMENHILDLGTKISSRNKKRSSLSRTKKSMNIEIGI